MFSCSEFRTIEEVSFNIFKSSFSIPKLPQQPNRKIEQTNKKKIKELTASQYYQRRH
jgi:hypothetical protein